MLAEKVLGEPALGKDTKFATNPKRVENRKETDVKVATSFATHDVAELMKKLEAADIAFARVNDWELLSKHAHMRRITVGAPSGPVSMPGWPRCARGRSGPTVRFPHWASTRKSSGMNFCLRGVGRDLNQ